MGLREFVELFDKNEVKNLFNALSSCIEYVRIDLHVFNIGAYVTCLYRRAFNEWKDDYKFFTELTLVLNHKIWQHYESDRELAALYDRLWREADEYAMNNFKGEELDYYYRVTD